MSLLEAIILGIVQGLTEFLPVSSSGHIELVKAIFKEEGMPEEGILFTIILHAATALSTVVIFRKDLLEILKGLLQFKLNKELIFAICIAISMVPAGIVGMKFEDDIDNFFSGNVLLVGFMLIITGLLLFLADRAKSTEKGVKYKEAIIVGIAQAIAILPGISRSGATIGTSVLLGIDRSKAARFSFLMVVPLIAGAMVIKAKKMLDVSELEALNTTDRVELIVGEIKEEGIFTDVQVDSLKTLIEHRETHWEDFNIQRDSLAFNVEAKAKAEYLTNLAGYKLSKEQEEFLTKDEIAGFRSVFKTSVLAIVIGFIAAFVTGLFACKWMIALVKKSQLKYFSFYCFLVGAVAIVLSTLG